MFRIIIMITSISLPLFLNSVSRIFSWPNLLVRQLIFRCNIDRSRSLYCMSLRSLYEYYSLLLNKVLVVSETFISVKFTPPVLYGASTMFESGNGIRR